MMTRLGPRDVSKLFVLQIRCFQAADSASWRGGCDRIRGLFEANTNTPVSEGRLAQMLIEPPAGARGVLVRGCPTADRYPRHMAGIALSTKSLRTGGGIAEDIRDRNLSSLLGWLHRHRKHTQP